MTDSPLKVSLASNGQLLELKLARPKANIIDAQMINVFAFPHVNVNRIVFSRFADNLKLSARYFGKVMLQFPGSQLHCSWRCSIDNYIGVWSPVFDDE